MIMTTSCDIAFTPAVKALQTRRGSRARNADMEQQAGWPATVTAELAAFIAEATSFYIATASKTGQPYIQHRGGPKGFLKVLDEKTLGFADFAGNRQYITAGNLTENNRAFLFLMDYAHRRRIKIWGEARMIEGDRELVRRLTPPDYRARVEQAVLFTVTAWDVNCPQHIVPRYTEEQIAPVVAELKARILALEAELARVKAKA